MRTLRDCNHIGECQIVKLSDKHKDRNSEETHALLSHDLQQLVMVGTKQEMLHQNNIHQPDGGSFESNTLDSVDPSWAD